MINPEDHFTPTFESVQRLLDRYRLELIDFEPATSGLENTTLFVTTQLGRQVLRVYRQHNKDDRLIEAEVNFMEHLRRHRLPVPKIIPASNSSPVAHTLLGATTWQAILMEVMSGRHPHHYTPDLVDNMADLQARMHYISHEYSIPCHIHRTRYLYRQPFISKIDCGRLADQRLTSFLERAKLHTVVLPDTLPHGLCHLDIDKGNLLTDNTHAITGLLDFDDLADAPFVMDIAHALWAVHYFGDAQVARAYRTKYESLRPLNQLESNYLPAILLFRHYLVSSMFIANGIGDGAAIEKYLTIERMLRESVPLASEKVLYPLPVR